MNENLLEIASSFAIFIFNSFMRFLYKSLLSSAHFTLDKHEKLMENVWLRIMRKHSIYCVDVLQL